MTILGKKHIIFLQGGLGNQLFQYAFYLAKKEKGENVVCDGTLLQISVQHNGFELKSIFNLGDVESSTNKLLLRIVCRFIINKKFKQKGTVLKFLSFCGLELVIDTISFVYKINLSHSKHRIWYFGYWQTEKYFIHIRPQLLDTFRFDESKLSDQTLVMKNQMQYSNSVSLHVRRGDYLSVQNKKLYEGICTLDYYERAIAIMREKVKRAVFYVFSDDMDWVKQNLKVPNAIFIDWNRQTDSWQDMYLMSQCKHNIIANSTFSWWGAWLNTNSEKIVVSPSKFVNSSMLSDIIPESWIKL